jgi:cell division protein FtsZ
MSEMGAAMMGSGEASGENRAREAAEKAIRSPLLEDINLAGAKGILVNITAGLNLAIGEFDEVGNTVREFADDDATVVVGTVIDPEMKDEMRVTVVATGLGEASVAKLPKPTKSDAPAVQLVNSDIIEQATPENYRELDRPTVLRNGAPGRSMADPTSEGNLDYLDIPAFLRRQAD